ncbi:c-type cytochrome biogenesis protein CcmI [Sulfuritalea sp.]|uniref:c-type cytochrome biogenesis protein CcmI n=1 Tax=Sulfuritalea sp. TaxID=2480090 RepID=UPI00286DF829|nr:c-type cytochrome biogenesis protein CcmI [Sulfuritalea sp.]
MSYFYLAAATLVVVALVLLLRPWWPVSRRIASANSLPALNAAIHRDRLAELERDRNNGVLSADDLAEAREELQRQLLDDTAATEVSAVDGFSRRSGIALAIVLPLLAGGLYALLGSPAAVLPVAVQTQRASADMEQLAAKLAQKLEQNPDNPEGWAMLARSYKALGRWDDAERAFGRVGPELNKNADLLAEVAELLVQKNNGFNPRSRELIQQSLRLEPDNMLALFLGGGEALDGGRHAEAAALWERLLPQLEPGSEDARMVESSIAMARGRSGGAPSRPAKADVVAGAVMPQDEVHKGVAKAATGAAPGKPPASAAASAVSGRVELAAALKGKANPEDVVFIFARAVDGPRMPLAAKRVRAADLPLDFTLDDSQAVMPGANLSSAQQVRIEVRISKSGMATPGKGDLSGKSAAVKPGAKGLRIVIDQIDS